MKKLNFEMIPDGCWRSNLRTILPPQMWDIIRKNAYKRAGGKCEICGFETLKLDAHEQWSYNLKTKTQKLENVIAVCKKCHSVIHIGRTQLCGDIDSAIEHYKKVNDCNYAEYIRELGEANKLNAERNRVDEWLLDLNWLKIFGK